MSDNVTHVEWEVPNKAIEDLATAMREGFQDLRREVIAQSTPPDPPEPLNNEHPFQMYHRRPRDPIADRHALRRSSEVPIQMYHRRNSDPPIITYPTPD